MMMRGKMGRAWLAVAGAGLLLLAGPGSAAPAGMQRGMADTALAPASIRAYEAGEAALMARDTQKATDYFEAALAADPRNLAAFVGLARAAEAEGLPGKAVRFYREALEIDPHNQTVIEAQGNAYLARGATGRAEANVARLEQLCGSSACPAADRLKAAVARGTRQVAVAEASAAASKPGER